MKRENCSGKISKKYMRQLITIAIPKGRLLIPIIKLFDEAGISLNVREKKYGYKLSNGSFDLLIRIYKNRDIPKLVSRGICEMGFASSDWIAEEGTELRKMLETDIGSVKLVAAVHRTWNDKTLDSKRVTCATEYVNLAKNFFNKIQIPAKIIKTHGASESYVPCWADIIIDTCETGRSLKENDLIIWKELFDSTVWLVAKPRLNKQKIIYIEEFAQKICQVLTTK